MLRQFKMYVYNNVWIYIYIYWFLSVGVCVSVCVCRCVCYYDRPETFLDLCTMGCARMHNGPQNFQKILNYELCTNAQRI